MSQPETPAWSEVPPKVPGWYWWRNPKHAGGPYCVRIFAVGPLLYIGDKALTPSDYGGKWLGPLSPDDAAELVRLRADLEAMTTSREQILTTAAADRVRHQDRYHELREARTDLERARALLSECHREGICGTDLYTRVCDYLYPTPPVFRPQEPPR